MSSEEVLKNCDSKMKKAFDIFKSELASLRTGRANVSMLDIVKVDVYGQKMPINQLATISTPDPRSISVQVWDQNNVTLIDSAIKESGSFPLVVNYSVVISKKSTEEIPKLISKDKPMPKGFHRQSQLNNRYIFDNFIEGSSNKIALSSSKKIIV